MPKSKTGGFNSIQAHARIRSGSLVGRTGLPRYWSVSIEIKKPPLNFSAHASNGSQDLRRQQQTRIQEQQNPDGTPYAPRKQRKNIRGKQARIKKQKASMFNKLRTNPPQNKGRR
ncbi:phage virion morphogenesis protein [Undibacterium sp. KW1]|uniref:phage virion morphogenesis protein n=1 Tax=Undibacterium sp. KW1 TaxID=2058624 RepID=UPI001389C234|nr:phage virion morphogenesis protein [Undibacterium sp. KW1]